MQMTRIARLAERLHQEIATIIHQELKDPRLGFITVTRLELSKDLRHAKVFFSCLGSEEDRVRCQEALERSAGFMHGLIKKRFSLKVIPQLAFQYDESIAESIELSEKLDALRRSPPERPRAS